MSSRDFGAGSMPSIQASPISIRGFALPHQSASQNIEDLPKSPDFPVIRQCRPETSMHRKSQVHVDVIMAYDINAL